MNNYFPELPDLPDINLFSGANEIAERISDQNIASYKLIGDEQNPGVVTEPELQRQISTHQETMQERDLRELQTVQTELPYEHYAAASSASWEIIYAIRQEREGLDEETEARRQELDKQVEAASREIGDMGLTDALGATASMLIEREFHERLQELDDRERQALDADAVINDAIEVVGQTWPLPLLVDPLEVVDTKTEETYTHNDENTGTKAYVDIFPAETGSGPSASVDRSGPRERPERIVNNASLRIIHMLASREGTAMTPEEIGLELYGSDDPTAERNARSNLHNNTNGNVMVIHNWLEKHERVLLKGTRFYLDPETREKSYHNRTMIFMVVDPENPPETLATENENIDDIWSSVVLPHSEIVDVESLVDKIGAEEDGYPEEQEILDALCDIDDATKARRVGTTLLRVMRDSFNLTGSK